MLIYPLIMIAENLNAITRRIASCCEKARRPADEVKLVCVTKEATTEEIEEVIDLGVRIVGENRVQDSVIKHRVVGDRVEWHLIGHLQTNKVKDAVNIFSLIHSVDSIRIAAAIDKEARRTGKIQDVLIEVNVSGESTKFGVSPQDLKPFVKELASCPDIRVKGLMTIAPETANPEETRPCFRALRELRDEFNRGWLLSMGMSNDFEVAIEEGANLVRIGRAIFNPR